MKKLLFAALPLIFVLLLGGCSFNAADSGESHRYLIASMGFDKQDEKFTATVEAVAVNSEDNEGKKRILITGEGKTPSLAMADAEKKATQPFNLSHCGVIVFGKGLNQEDFSDICDYCYDTDEITFSAYIVSADDAAELLKPEPISSVAAGYDIMSIMQKVGKTKGIEFQNSLYEVVAHNDSKDGKTSLPFFSLSDEYRVTDRFAVYKKGKLSGFEKF